MNTTTTLTPVPRPSDWTTYLRLGNAIRRIARDDARFRVDVDNNARQQSGFTFVELDVPGTDETVTGALYTDDAHGVTFTVDARLDGEPVDGSGGIVIRGAATSAEIALAITAAYTARRAGTPISLHPAP